MDNFIKFISDKNIEKLDFIKFTKKICQKDILQDCNNYLINLFGNKPPIKPQILLSSLLIYYHHQVVLSSEKNILEKEVHESSKELFGHLLNNSLDIELLKIEILKWDKLFKYWKEMDKKDLLGQMAQYYREVLNIGGDNEEIKKKIRNLAIRIDSKDGVNNVENGSKTGLLSVDILKTQIRNNMKQAFWDIFKKELSNNPPIFDMYLNLVKEIKDDLLSILPKKNIDKTKYIINKKIDINFIIEKLRLKTYNLQDIYNLIYFILDTIKNLDSAESQKRIENKMLELEKNMNNNKNISIFLPNIFCFIFEELVCLKTWCEIYKKNL